MHLLIELRVQLYYASTAKMLYTGTRKIQAQMEVNDAGTVKRLSDGPEILVYKHDRHCTFPYR